MAKPTVALSVSDYAAQHETLREFTGTCCNKEKHNDCVTCIGYKPFKHTISRESWCKRKVDTTIELTKQRCDVFYGMFFSNHKASAHHYNMQRQDVEHFLKFGTTLHGEWFMDGERLPRKDEVAHKEPLPTGNQPNQAGNEDEGQPWTLRDAAVKDPDFPEMEQHIESTDGCSSQFQGEANIGEVDKATTLYSLRPSTGASRTARKRTCGPLQEQHNENKNNNNKSAGLVISQSQLTGVQFHHHAQ